MLEARGLTKFYSGIAAVKDVSFQVRAGEILGYLGPNGSGKTTTVNMIIGLVEPSRGEVLFEGRPIAADPAGFRRRVGYVPEEPNLYPFLSGREYRAHGTSGCCPRCGTRGGRLLSRSAPPGRWRSPT